MIMLKSPREIDLLREAGLIVAETLQLMRESVRPGVTTAELDAIAEEHIRSRGASPAFKGYRVAGVRFPYPASICASINEEVVHGIPGERKLREGDIISIDVGTRFKKYYGDAAVTLPVGRVSEAARRLLETTEGALGAAIGVIRPEMALRDLSRAIQQFAEERGYSVVRKFVGHGIGRQMHEDPQVPNFVGTGSPAGSLRLPVGTVIAIEPMVNEHDDAVEVLDNGWTVRTRDGGLSAHFEHSVAITESGPRVLTVLEE
jgi:methionyl aminopeptidase